MVQPNGTSWHKMEYVEQCVQGEAGFRSTWNNCNKDTWVFRSLWNKWNKDKGSVQLNLSTCFKVGLQGRETFPHDHDGQLKMKK